MYSICNDGKSRSACILLSALFIATLFGCSQSQSEVTIKEPKFTSDGLLDASSLGWKKLDPRVEQALHDDFEEMAVIKKRMLKTLYRLQAEGVFTPDEPLDYSSDSTQGVICFPGGWTFIN